LDTSYSHANSSIPLTWQQIEDLPLRPQKLITFHDGQLHLTAEGAEHAENSLLGPETHIDSCFSSASCLSEHNDRQASATFAVNCFPPQKSRSSPAFKASQQ